MPNFFSRHTLPDGTEVHVRYQDQSVAHVSAHTKLPTGKAIALGFDGRGIQTSESHGYGMLVICLDAKFKEGVKTEEMYFVNKRLVSRVKYEKAREAYPDMPAADVSPSDIAAELSSDIAAERRQQRSRAKKHVANPERAAKLEEFCRKLFADGNAVDAIQPTREGHMTLGERNKRSSRSLIDTLTKYGAGPIWACHVQECEPGLANSGDLVLQLPSDGALRAKLLGYMGKLAREQGFDPDVDDGQTLGYLKLD